MNMWLIIGWLVWLYYTAKNHDEYQKKITSGKLKFHNFAAGFILTVLFWPVTIYNQEIRRKRG